MKLIQKLAEQIDEELNDAMHYAKWALEVKQDYPALAKSLYGISLQETDHAKILHDSVTEIIREYREEHGDPPASMMAVYDYLHEKQIDKSAEVKNLHALFKE